MLISDMDAAPFQCCDLFKLYVLSTCIKAHDLAISNPSTHKVTQPTGTTVHIANNAIFNSYLKSTFPVNMQY